MKLLLVSALLLVLSTLTADGVAVYDNSGDALKPGTPYHIRTFAGPGGGGLFPRMRPRICPPCRFCCPLNVAYSLLNIGHPVIVSPSDSGEEVVHLLTDVKIEFTGISPNNGSGVWKLDRTDPNGQRYVTLNGDPNNAIDASNWFKIEKFGTDSYKLLYCPSVKMARSDGPCGSLGLSFEDGNTPFSVGWLVLGNQPFEIVFIKA